MGRQTTTSQVLNRSCDQDDTVRILDIIFEGLTEKQYFEHLIQNDMLKPYIYVDYIGKGSLDKDESNRSKMMEIAHDYTIQKWSGNITYRRYISIVFENFYEEYIKIIRNDPELFKKYDKEKTLDEVLQFRNETLSRYQNMGYDLGGWVPEQTDSDKPLYARISEECSKRFNVPYMIENTDILFKGGGGRKTNEDVYIMFDRDFNELWFNDEMYSECLEKCKKYRYNPLITTPQFELWLLMHFEGADFDYPYDGGYKFRMLSELQKYDYVSRSTREKTFDDERFGLYQHNIQRAIKTSELDLFEKDPETLINHIGTNLGQFIKDLLLDP